MKTEDVLKLFPTQQAVASFLGITRSAVHQWGDEVPELRQYQLRELRPTIDAEISNMKAQARELRASA